MNLTLCETGSLSKRHDVQTKRNCGRQDGLVVSTALLLLSMGLILADTILTRRGLSRGLPEVNPIVRYVLEKLGSTGFAMTRLAALIFLLILFWIIDPWKWIIFASTFSAVMGYVVLVGVRNLMVPRAEPVVLTPGPSAKRD